ncbi:MAG: hypothetical protein Q9187_001282 [Circinaria calcarea]
MDSSSTQASSGELKDHVNTQLVDDQPQDLEKQHLDEADARSGTAKSPREIQGIKWVIVVTSILSSTFLFSLDNTIVADIQPAIIEDFGEIEKLPWLGAAFALGAVSVLPWGKAYGVFDIKWLYIVNVGLFEIGSAICGAAPTLSVLIVGRAVAGVGGSGMYCGCLTYLSVTTSEYERPRYISLVGLVWGIGTVLGPVIGGAFAQSSATWRWAFWINLVIGAIFAPAFLFVLPDIRLQKETSFAGKLKQMDWLGIVVFEGAMACFIMAITFGGSSFPWQSASEITLWIMAGVLSIIFGFTQKIHPFVPGESKLYPTQFLRRPLLLNLQFQIFLASGVLLGAAYYIPLYFQFARGDTALKAGVRLLPYVTAIVVFCLLNGALMPKLGYYQPWYLFGGAMILIGSALMYTASAITKPAAVYGYILLLGVGVGSYVQAGFAITECLVSPTELAHIVGFMSVAQSMGIVVFLAVMGSVYQNLAILRVSQVLPSDTAVNLRQLVAGTYSGIFKSLPESTRDEVVVAVISAMRFVWLMPLTAGAVTVIFSCFLGKNKLFRTG